MIILLNPGFTCGTITSSAKIIKLKCFITYRFPMFFNVDESADLASIKSISVCLSLLPFSSSFASNSSLRVKKNVKLTTLSKKRKNSPQLEIGCAFFNARWMPAAHLSHDAIRLLKQCSRTPMFHLCFVACFD